MEIFGFGQPDDLGVPSSYNPIPGFQGGTVRHTLVTETEKKGHQIGHYFS